MNYYIIQVETSGLNPDDYERPCSFYNVVIKLNGTSSLNEMTEGPSVSRRRSPRHPYSRDETDIERLGSRDRASMLRSRGWVPYIESSSHRARHTRDLA